MNNVQSYAKALLEISKENNVDINQVISELQLVNNCFDEEFIKFLNNPKISKDNKKEIFIKYFQNELDKNVFAALMVLIDNKKIVYLNEVINELEQLIFEEKGIITIEVLTVNELSSIELENIRQFFSNKLNKIINLKQIIDKNLVGGLIIKYQGKIIDGSLLNKQESLKEYLKK